MRLASMITTTTTAFHHPKTTMTMAMTTGTNLNTNTNAKTFNVAIIGGGITGSCAASMLTSFNNIKSNGSKQSEQHKHIEPMLSNLFGQQQDGQITSSDDDIRINVDLFDQGRSGVGGRTSHRRRKIQNNDGTDEHQHQALRWDHGCQFFRADTPQFKKVVSNWMSKDLNLVSEWKGNFISNNNNKSDNSANNDFFGLPSQPPFYVGNDGMQSISKGLLENLQQNHEMEESSSTSSSLLNIFTGTRVAQIERNNETNKWTLQGVDGIPAYHDTPEKIVQKLNAESDNNNKNILGSDTVKENGGYDAVLLTDVSSSFGKWHRASAGVPEEFASRVRERVGARVPLFTAMIAFEKDDKQKSDNGDCGIIPFDAASFAFENNDTLWFASKMNSKPMNQNDNDMKLNKNVECWTLVSTPEYAMKKIEETPMQTESGEFIPQSKDYLTSVPGPDLESAFRQEITSKDGILGDDALDVADLPKTIFLDAQRWGSAMPCHRHLDDKSTTRKVISGVPYDSGRAPLAPTKLEKQTAVEEKTFLSDDSLMLFQAGDMMSTYTPGFEGAAISGMDAAEYLLSCLCKMDDDSKRN